jgi:hypothetical protein
MHELGMNDEFCSLYLAPQASRSARRLRAAGTLVATELARQGGASTFGRSIGREPRSGFVRRGVVP